MPHRSIDNTLTTLQRLAPDSAFLALGQTVFWDEPVKAVWRRILDRYWPSAQLIAGIHDTDYFAKSTAHVPDDQEFIALAHDDGATRGLWSAAGELSSLFGSEDLPTRSFYESLGIPFDQLAGHDFRARRSLFSEYTSAYGWRGIVQTTGTSQIAHDVLLSKFSGSLLSLLDWGFEESVSCLASNSAEHSSRIVSTIKGWVVSYLESCSSKATLSDLYQHLLPKFYELLLETEPSNFSVTSTASILRFNETTCHLPRFAFIQHFLDPNTREIAISAYSKAVAGGGMYALDHFGDDALPFDVVVPGLGRGTLHISQHDITVDFAPLPKTIEIEKPITTVNGLANILSNEFGGNVVLVGKAVSLISMLAAEFIVVFHETASGYTDRTAEMNNLLRRQGIELNLLPIVRMQYNTWDSLASANYVKLRLPNHLAEPFHTPDETIEPGTFAANWRQVVEQQEQLILRLKEIREIRSLLDYLQDTQKSTHWATRRSEYENALNTIKSNYELVQPISSQIAEAESSMRKLSAERAYLEKASGNDYRTRLRPLQEKSNLDRSNLSVEISKVEDNRRRRFAEPLTAKASEIRSLKRTRKELITSKRRAERNAETVAARQLISAIAGEANLAKLRIARSAYLAAHGLPHTNARPTSWWLPLVDPTGTWFDTITDTVEARLEYV